ncbi:hypothetical protein MSKU9_1234 [Komagataeibacter diospyri]|uniref:Uncharacterized protein n=1 Tax=Komagataeibacter diospyri TaxID=1932662 RepID=A0A4P5NNX4_9PROT|nr:hypothetical protein MSKU9_1234 [Komagataeibacter diospyri]
MPVLPFQKVQQSSLQVPSEIRGKLILTGMVVAT